MTTSSVAHLVRTYRAAKTSCDVHRTVRVLGFAYWHVFNGKSWLIQTMQASVPLCTNCSSIISFQLGIPVPNSAVPAGVTHSSVYVVVAGRELLCS